MTSKLPTNPVAFVTGGSGFLGRNLIPYLVAHGWRVKALGRSDGALKAVQSVGAEPVRGDLSSIGSVVEALKGCDVVFHSAAWANDWGELAEAWEANVVGTENVVAAAKAAGVSRLVHVSTEAVLVDGKQPIVQADELRPLPEKPLGPYSISKGAAETLVRKANGPGFETVVVRPRFIWGKGDTTILPKLVESTRAGVLQWIGGGEYLSSTCHVTNVCEGMLKAAERGRGGEVYFLTDGPPQVFKSFISRMLQTQGVTPPVRSVPRFLVGVMAYVGDWVWRVFGLKGAPPLSPAAFHLMGNEVTVSDAKARRELGYVAEISVERGLAEMKV